jgi:hypothetical protein
MNALSDMVRFDNTLRHFTDHLALGIVGDYVFEIPLSSHSSGVKKMKRIGLLTDNWGTVSVKDALIILEESNEYRVETIQDFQNIESISQTVWSMLNLVDIVVAHITKDSRNIYYEIGLAHGLGKPVIIIVEGDTILSGDLTSQRMISINKSIYSPRNLAFQIKEAIDWIDHKGKTFTGYRGPREEIGKYPISGLNASFVPDFRSVLLAGGPTRAARFEQWLSRLADAVPGWEVIESTWTRNPDQGFDLVIWNSREDFELNALGNPIPIELKSIQSMNSSTLSGFLNRTRKSGLKSVVLATTGINKPRVLNELSRLRRHEGINAIALDREDLIQISSPEDLLVLFKKKIRQLLYEEEL